MSEVRKLAARLRVSLGGGFRWRSGDHPHLYGLPYLSAAREGGEIVVCEGESDWQTLRFHGIHALALPGASTWKPAWDDYLEGFQVVTVVIEPDRGGEAMRNWVASSRARERVRLVLMPTEFKDPSALHVDDPERFDERWAGLLAAAVPWREPNSRKRPPASLRHGRLAGARPADQTSSTARDRAAG